MLKLPLVTFVVTSYNYEKYILKTLESIKAQTYKNFEIIVVDDCSSDNSCEIIEDFISDNQDLKITLIKNETNQGQLASMIRGLENAKGQFISFIDSDDILLPEYAQSHIRVHMETSAAFTSCQIVEIGENDEVHTLNSNACPHCDNLDSLFASEKINFKLLKHKRFGGWYWSPNSSAMFRKASIELICNYKNTHKWKICPDKFLFNFANLIGGSAIIFKPLIGYRRHKNNAGNCSLVTGDKRLHSDYITKVNIQNNLKIRPETIKFLWEERNKIGIRNTVKLISTVLLSYIF
ncbi:putative glycosyltransferase [Fusobacterium sp. CAG:439]|nr:putative glycosyltransferase [Fusobacterium sp. CAG:439]